jgi:hypothetical protein
MVKTKTGVFAGSYTAQVGTVPWYPEGNIKIVEAYAFVEVAGGTNAVFNINVNGTSITPSIKPTISAGVRLSPKITMNTNVNLGDFLTIDVISAAGSNAAVVIVYQDR